MGGITRWQSYPTKGRDSQNRFSKKTYTDNRNVSYCILFKAVQIFTQGISPTEERTVYAPEYQMLRGRGFPSSPQLHVAG